MSSWTKAAVQGAACGLVFGAVALIGVWVWRPATVAAQAAAVPDVVKARRFEVVDAAGKTRGVLGVRIDGWAGLTLFDAAGKPRAGVGVTSDGGPGLSLYDPAGKPRAGLVVTPDGEPGLALYDAAGKMRADLSMTPHGGPALELYDAAGKLRATLGSTSLEVVKTGEERKRAESSLVLFNKDGKVIWEAP